MTELYGSAIIGSAAFGGNNGSINTDITFLTIGKKKILAVFNNNYVRPFFVDVVCTNYMIITFPNGIVTII